MEPDTHSLIGSSVADMLDDLGTTVRLLNKQADEHLQAARARYTAAVKFVEKIQAHLQGQLDPDTYDNEDLEHATKLVKVIDEQVKKLTSEMERRSMLYTQVVRRFRKVDEVRRSDIGALNTPENGEVLEHHPFFAEIMVKKSEQIAEKIRALEETLTQGMDDVVQKVRGLENPQAYR